MITHYENTNQNMIPAKLISEKSKQQLQSLHNRFVQIKLISNCYLPTIKFSMVTKKLLQNRNEKKRNNLSLQLIIQNVIHYINFKYKNSSLYLFSNSYERGQPEYLPLQKKSNCFI